MILQIKKSSLVGKQIGLSAVLLLIAGCSGAAKKSSDVVEIPDSGNYNYNTPTSTGTSATTYNIPTQLFDTTTVADPLPQTGAATTYAPVSQPETFCLGNDSYIFSGGTQNASCYGNRNAMTQDTLWSSALTMYSSLDQCINYALALEPTSENASDLQIRMNLAEMVILRCVRHQLRSQQNLRQWSPQQNQVYSGSDQMLYNWLGQIAQGR